MNSNDEILTNAKVLARIISLFFHPSRNVSSALYDLLSSKHVLGKRTLYMNMGYWKEARDFDAAADALAELLARTAGFDQGDEVLDVGFGFADQDMFWVEKFPIRRIVGVNITESQLLTARQRVAERKLDSKIDLRLGSATNLSFDALSFDHVVSLDSAFHFDTREDFFKEAYRVLKPGGRLTVADKTPVPGLSPQLKQKIADFINGAFWQIPSANAYDRNGYRERLEKVGFEQVEIQSIRDDVVRPFGRFMLERLESSDYVPRSYAVIRSLWKLGAKALTTDDTIDYIIATARKPSSS